MRGLTSCLIAGLALLAAVFAPAAAEARTGSCLLRAGGPRCQVWTGKVTFLADGDTIWVDVDHDGTARPLPIRITGIDAMEQTVFATRASQRRGECHALEATARLESLLRAGKWRVRLAAQDPASHAGKRPRRSVAVRINGRWRDVGRILVQEGDALWLPNRHENAWNFAYSVLSARAAAAGLNLWDPDYCAPGPTETANVRMWVNWDADGPDSFNAEGEWVRIKNLDPVNALPLGGWWLRDSGVRRYRFPSWATVPAGGEITVYVGVGDTTDTDFYWNRPRPLFENVTRDETQVGDGAYLFDPDGDLRMAMLYPCRIDCTDPNLGAIELAARPGRREMVTLTNVSAAPVDLGGYRLTSRPYGYDFSPDSVLQPGETMRVRISDGLEEDRPLTRFWATDGPILDERGDTVELRRYDDVVIACTSWGTRAC